MYNPLLLVMYVLTNPVDDLAIVALLITMVFFVLMATGAYLLCRDYGAKPWVSAAIGAALPLSGFTSGRTGQHG